MLVKPDDNFLLSMEWAILFKSCSAIIKCVFFGLIRNFAMIGLFWRSGKVRMNELFRMVMLEMEFVENEISLIIEGLIVEFETGIIACRNNNG